MEKNSTLVNGLVAGRRRDGRCCYDPAAKEELIRTCLRPGVSIARLAMQHGINANLLRTWVARYQKENVARQKEAIPEIAPDNAPAFTPIQIEMPPANLLSPHVPASAGHLPVTAASLPAPFVQTGVEEKALSIRLRVQLPNGVALDISDANLDALSPLMHLLSKLPCSDSTTR
jgi:transposase